MTDLAKVSGSPSHLPKSKKLHFLLLKTDKIQVIALSYSRHLSLSLFLLLSLGLSYPEKGRAQDCSSVWARLLGYRSIASESTLITSGRAEQTELPRIKMRILVWNAQKHLHPDWEQDFSNLEKQADLLLLQETATSPTKSTFAGFEGKEWTTVQSYGTKKFTTGVTTGSRSSALRHLALRSSTQEPILRTPKSALLSVFALSGGADQLLVVNIHALNFTNLVDYRRQIEEIIPYFRNHRGPIIVAGDLNTWNKGRIKYLEEKMAAYGLYEVVPEGKSWPLTLDRIFIRGGKAAKARILNNTNSSDHYPIELELDFN